MYLIVKYLIIILTNLSLLIVLLYLWTNACPILYSLQEFIEFAKLIGLSIVTVLIFLLVSKLFSNKLIINNLKLFGLLTVLVFAFKYVQYINLVVENCIIKRNLFESACAKIEVSNGMKVKVSHLTIDEYLLFERSITIPYLAIPTEAQDISLDCYEDGFLPDFHAILTYKVPKHIHIEIIEVKKDQYVKNQSYKLENDFKLVTYYEASW